MSALGYIDEVIGHIDSGKKVFQVLGQSKTDCLRWARVNPSIASELIVAPKFTLPTLGQFYRPINDLHERDDGKFSLYAEPYEIDMLQYPPFQSFVLEFAGFDDNIRMVSTSRNDVVFSKYVVWCRVLHPSSISLTPFYYSTLPVEDIPVGWVANGVTFTLRYAEPANRVRAKSGLGFGIQFSVEGEPDWELDILGSMISGMVPEIRALLQFLVVMNVKSGIIRTDAQTPHKHVARTGRRIGGYTYHVLDIDPSYVAERRSLGGSHASPGFHVRRAHLRHYKSERFSKAFTFVRQTFVGNVLDGVVDKDYNIKNPK